MWLGVAGHGTGHAGVCREACALRTALRNAFQHPALRFATPGRAVTGVSWVVHPNAFVVHVPHEKAATYKVTKKTKQWDHVSVACWA